MVHRSAQVQIAGGSITHTHAVEAAKVVFDKLWDCTPETRPFNIVQCRASSEGGMSWVFIVDAEDD